MASTQYGRRLNPYRRLRVPLGVKGSRQSVTITNNPSTIDQNQQLLIRFPNIGANDVIVPGTVRLAFTILLTSTHVDRTIVQNLGHAIVKKTTIKINGNEVMSIDDSDVYYCYQDLCKTAQERKNAQYQGIDTNRHRNVARLRTDAGNKADNVAVDNAVAAAYGNRFYIPLDFELLESHMPYYQSALADRLEYELSFNEYSRVLITTDPTSTYSIDNISLEYDMVTVPSLARSIRDQYASRLSILYDRILHHRKMTKDKSDTLWNVNINVPARSMKGILMLFDEVGTATGARNTEQFYNPNITKVEVTIEGIPNQLYSQGMRSHQQWDEIKKQFAGGSKSAPEVDAVAKDLELADVSLAEYLTSKYALWLDMRTSDDDQLHSSCRKVENASEGVTIQIAKEAETAGALNVYLYIITDAQLNIEDGRFINALY